MRCSFLLDSDLSPPLPWLCSFRAPAPSLSRLQPPRGTRTAAAGGDRFSSSDRRGRRLIFAGLQPLLFIRSGIEIPSFFSPCLSSQGSSSSPRSLSPRWRPWRIALWGRSFAGDSRKPRRMRWRNRGGSKLELGRPEKQGIRYPPIDYLNICVSMASDGTDQKLEIVGYVSFCRAVIYIIMNGSLRIQR